MVQLKYTDMFNVCPETPFSLKLSEEELKQESSACDEHCAEKGSFQTDTIITRDQSGRLNCTGGVHHEFKNYQFIL